MLPLFKVFSLIIKIFSKPVVNYTKKMHMNRKNNSHQWLRRFFIFLGNKYHLFETKINRKFLNVSSEFAFRIKPLNDDDALTKGVEFFYEIILYSILIIFPLYEMQKGQNEAKEKSKAINDRLVSLDEGIQKIRIDIKNESNNLTQKVTNFQDLVDQFEKSIEDAHNEAQKDSEELKNELNNMIEKTSNLARDISLERKELMVKANELFEQQNGIISLLKQKKRSQTSS